MIRRNLPKYLNLHRYWYISKYSEISRYTKTKMQIEEYQLTSHNAILRMHWLPNPFQQVFKNSTFKLSKIQIFAYTLHNQKFNKYRGISEIAGQFKAFADLQQFYAFLSAEPSNYQWKENQKVLEVKFKIVSGKFQSVRIEKIKFQKVQFSEKEKIQNQNKLLRKQIQQLKKKDKTNNLKKQKKNTNQNKSESKNKENPQQNQSAKKSEKEQKQASSRIDIEEKEEHKKMSPIFEMMYKKQKITQRSLGQKVKSGQNLIQLTLDLGKKQEEHIKIQHLQQISSHEKYENKRCSIPEKTKKIFKPLSNERQCSLSQKFAKVSKQDVMKNVSKIQKACQFLQDRQLGDNYQIKYSDGSRYFGTLLNGKQHGKGIIYGNGYKFEGTWSYGQTNGPGKFTCDTGAIEMGIYKPGFKRYGFGQDYYVNGQSYTGEYKNEQKNGFGTYRYINGDYYEGFWKDGKSDGKGKEVQKNGNCYQGYWQRDEKDGEGIFTCSSSKIKKKQIWKMGVLIKQVPIIQI